MAADQHTPNVNTPPGVSPEQETASAAFQGGNRAASITPEGQGLNQTETEERRVHAVPKTPGHTGNVWSQDYAPKATTEAHGGFGVLDRDERPGAYPLDARDTTGSDLTWRDAQYGASPVRSARYDDDIAHQREADGGRAVEFGAHARLPEGRTEQTPRDERFDEKRPGFETEQSHQDLPGQGKDERGRYGQAPADNTEPETYGSNGATNGNRL
jgi:hypothetical protein